MNIASKGSITRIAAMMANAVARLLVSRRNMLICKEEEVGVELGTCPPRGAGDAPYEQSRQRIDDQRHQEQGKADFNEGSQMEIAGRFAELIGNDAGHSVARSKE